jgi:hypothetical protein
MNSPFLVPWNITSPSCCWWNPPWNANKSILILILVKKYQTLAMKQEHHHYHHDIIVCWSKMTYILIHMKNAKKSRHHIKLHVKLFQYIIYYHLPKRSQTFPYIHIIYIYIYIYIHIFPGYSQTSFHHLPKMQFWSLISYKCLFLRDYTFFKWGYFST